MKTLPLIILTILATVSGCKDKKSTSTQDELKIAPTPEQRPAICEEERPYELDRKQITKHHAALALAEFPEYALNVIGVGGYPNQDVNGDWAFIVPQDRITTPSAPQLGAGICTTS